MAEGEKDWNYKVLIFKRLDRIGQLFLDGRTMELENIIRDLKIFIRPLWDQKFEDRIEEIDKQHDEKINKAPRGPYGEIDKNIIKDADKNKIFETYDAIMQVLGRKAVLGPGKSSWKEDIEPMDESALNESDFEDPPEVADVKDRSLESDETVNKK